MTAQSKRIQLSIRMSQNDREDLANAAAAVGLDVSVAARMILELTLGRIRSGADFLDAVQELKQCYESASGEKKAA